MVVSAKGTLAAEAPKGRFGKGFPADLVRRTKAMLSAMDAAVVLEELRFPPGNHLEELKGNRAGQHSVRINDQWRIASAGPKKGLRTLRSWTVTEGTKTCPCSLPRLIPVKFFRSFTLHP